MKSRIVGYLALGGVILVSAFFLSASQHSTFLSFFGSGRQTAAVSDFDNVLAAHWRLNETGGSTATDSAGSNSGTYIAGPTLSSGGATFNGSSQYVSVPDAPALNFGTGDFSISAWINIPTCEAHTGGILNKNNGGAGIYFFVGCNGFNFTVYDASGGYRAAHNGSGGVIPDNQYMYVTAVRLSNEVYIYADGQLIATGIDGTLAAHDVSNSLPLTIGATTVSSGYLQGTISDVRLYNRALTQNEITQLYNQGDQSLPILTVSAPTNGATVLGSAVTLSAHATDNIGVAGVQFKVDGISVGSEATYGLNTKSVTPSIIWDSSSVPNGSHVISAVARDAAGNIGTNSVTVTVTNDYVPPVISNTRFLIENSPVTPPIAANTPFIGIEVTTDKNASCKYGTDSSTSYASLANSMLGDGTLTHTATINVTNSATFTYYVRCQVTSLDPNTSGYQVTFSVLADTVPPVIAGVGTSNLQQTSTNLTWFTSELSNSQVEYEAASTWSAGSYAHVTTLDTNLVNSHIVALPGLSPATTYHYRVRSADSNSNTAFSTDATFSTVATILSSKDTYIANITQGDDSGSSCANAHSVDWFNDYNPSTTLPINFGVGVGQIGPGDTIHLCGTIQKSLALNYDGLPGNPITLFFEPNARLSAPTWGTDRYVTTVVTGVSSTSTHPAMYSPNTQSDLAYWVIDGGTNGVVEATDNGLSKIVGEVKTINAGLQVTNCGATENGAVFGHNQESDGISLTNPTAIEIKNLTIKNMMQMWPSPCMEHSGAGISLSGQLNDVRIHDNSLSMIGNSVVLSWSGGVSRNVKVYNNSFRDQSFGIFVNIGNGAAPAQAYDFSIYNNTFDNADTWYAISGVALEWIHQNYIFLNSGSSGSVNYGLKIYNNTFGPHNGVMSNMIRETTYDGRYDHTTIFNNLFLNSGSRYDSTLCLRIACMSNGFIGAWGYNDQIFNNVFASFIGPDNAPNDNAISTDKNSVAFNNIFYNMTAAYRMSLDSPMLNSDNNAFDTVQTITTVRGVDVVDWFTIADWKAAYPTFDRNSNTIHPLLDSQYQPTSSDTAALGKGVNLTSYCGQIPELCYDRNGTHRPSTGAWDIGAYYSASGGAADTTAPSIPQSIVAESVSTSAVFLRWTSSTDLGGVSKYKVYRDNVYLGQTNTTTYNDSSVAAGSSYAYTVTAVDTSNNESNKSTALSVNVPTVGQTSLSISSGPTASSLTTTGATITWTTSISANSRVIYGLTQQAYGSDTGVIANMATGHSVVLSGLQANTTYHYYILSRDGSNNLATSSDHTFATPAVGTISCFL